MMRRAFLYLSAIVASPVLAEAQQSSFRIGILDTTSESSNSANLNGFRAGMRALGYSEGTNFTIEYRSAEGSGEHFTRLAEELVNLRMHVIVTRGTPAVLAAKRATQSIPIVMAAVGEPLMIVPSLAKPGGNVTGLSGYSTDLEAKRVEVLKEGVPGITRLAGIYNMGNPVVPAQWEQIQKSAQALNVKTQLL